MNEQGRMAAADAAECPEPHGKRVMLTPQSALPFEQRLGTFIKQAEQALMAEKNRVLRPFGLTVPQYAALLILAEHPLISGTRLARLCGVTAQAMNGVVRLLEQRDLVSRTQSADHAKVILLRLTPAGAALFQQADNAAVAVEQRLAGAYTTAELEQLRTGLAVATRTLTALSASAPAAQSRAAAEPGA